MSNNQRPGVYARYDVESVSAVPRSQRDAGLVCRGGRELAGKVRRVASYSEAVEELGLENNGRLLTCVKLLLGCGVRGIRVSAVEEDGYEAAVALLEQEEVGALICDADGLEELKVVKESLERWAKQGRERVAFAGVGDPAEALAAALALNSERMVLCTPGVGPGSEGETDSLYGACALAARVLASGDPGYNWSGERFEELGRPERLAEERIQELLRGGVTVFEEVGDGVECIRAVTTRTRTNGVEDHTLRSLSTILIIDDVMRSVRDTLKQRLRGLRMSGQSMRSIRSQVAVELAAKQDENLIESFESPQAYAHGEDPAVCVVELSFRVAHVVHQIHVTAHIQV